MKSMKRVALSSIVTCLLLILFSVSVVTAKSEVIPNDETGIPDKTLYQAILRTLDKGSDETFTKNYLLNMSLSSDHLDNLSV